MGVGSGHHDGESPRNLRWVVIARPRMSTPTGSRAVRGLEDIRIFTSCCTLHVRCATPPAAERRTRRMSDSRRKLFCCSHGYNANLKRAERVMHLKSTIASAAARRGVVNHGNSIAPLPNADGRGDVARR
jgi:hypothetical protein